MSDNMHYSELLGFTGDLAEIRVIEWNYRKFEELAFADGRCTICGPSGKVVDYKEMRRHAYNMHNVVSTILNQSRIWLITHIVHRSHHD
jgi:hypothetical protein